MLGATCCVLSAPSALSSKSAPSTEHPALSTLSTLASACASDSSRSRARPHAGARSCTCHKFSLPTPELSCAFDPLYQSIASTVPRGSDPAYAFMGQTPSHLSVSVRPGLRRHGSDPCSSQRTRRTRQSLLTIRPRVTSRAASSTPTRSPTTSLTKFRPAPPGACAVISCPESIWTRYNARGSTSRTVPEEKTPGAFSSSLTWKRLPESFPRTRSAAPSARAVPSR